MIKFVKILLRPVRDHIRSSFIHNRLIDRVKKHSHLNFDSFNFEDFKRNTIAFIQSNQLDQKHFLYKYSASSTKPTLYASAYALMTLSLLGELDKLSTKEKDEWRQYFDSFQSAADGLFYDPVVKNDIYDDSDWWGARHLTLHMIAAYTDLGCRPKHSFSFLKEYYDPAFIQKWLDKFDWNNASIGEVDIDNKIMNVGCLLQYQRDYLRDIEAGQAVEYLKNYLRRKINYRTGMWGGFDIKNPHQRSRAIQFAYHLFQIYYFDGEYDFDCDRIVNLALKTKNKLNGFGVKLNSSACEDIDSIEMIIRLQKKLPLEIQKKVRNQIKESFRWVMTNQVADGGFVFRLEEAFAYGCIETSSIKNEGAMLPTWFRTLSIAYMYNYLNMEDNFKINSCPGYEFK